MSDIVGGMRGKGLKAFSVSNMKNSKYATSVNSLKAKFNWHDEYSDLYYGRKQDYSGFYGLSVYFYAPFPEGWLACVSQMKRLRSLSCIDF